MKVGKSKEDNLENVRRMRQQFKLKDQTKPNSNLPTYNIKINNTNINTQPSQPITSKIEYHQQNLRHIDPNMNNPLISPTPQDNNSVKIISNTISHVPTKVKIESNKNLLSFNEYKDVLIKRRIEEKESLGFLERESRESQKKLNDIYRGVETEPNFHKQTVKDKSNSNKNLVKKPKFQSYKSYVQMSQQQLSNVILENKLISTGHKNCELHVVSYSPSHANVNANVHNKEDSTKRISAADGILLYNNTNNANIKNTNSNSNRNNNINNFNNVNNINNVLRNRSPNNNQYQPQKHEIDFYQVEHNINYNHHLNNNFNNINNIIKDDKQSDFFSPRIDGNIDEKDFLQSLEHDNSPKHSPKFRMKDDDIKTNKTNKNNNNDKVNKLDFELKKLQEIKDRLSPIKKINQSDNEVNLSSNPSNSIIKTPPSIRQSKLSKVSKKDKDRKSIKGSIEKIDENKKARKQEEEKIDEEIKKLEREMAKIFEGVSSSGDKKVNNKNTHKMNNIHHITHTGSRVLTNPIATELTEENERVMTNNKNTKYGGVISGSAKKNSNKDYEENKFEQFNIQQIVYDLAKEYGHIKLNKKTAFMERMLFDVFKRQSKEKRIDLMLLEQKKKTKEVKRIETFNRLIDDANRRLESKLKEKNNEEIEEMNQYLKSNKKYKKEEWEEIYTKRYCNYIYNNYRFLNYEKEKQEKIKKKEEAQIQKKLLEEKQIIDFIKKHPKVDPLEINQFVERMSEDAMRRKLGAERLKIAMEQQNESQIDNNLKPNELKEYSFSKNYKTLNTEGSDNYNISEQPKEKPKKFKKVKEESDINNKVKGRVTTERTETKGNKVKDNKNSNDSKGKNIKDNDVRSHSQSQRIKPLVYKKIYNNNHNKSSSDFNNALSRSLYIENNSALNLTQNNKNVTFPNSICEESVIPNEIKESNIKTKDIKISKRVLSTKGSVSKFVPESTADKLVDELFENNR